MPLTFKGAKLEPDSKLLSILSVNGKRKQSKSLGDFHEAVGNLGFSSELERHGWKASRETRNSEAPHLQWQWWVSWGCCWGQICGFLPGNYTEVHSGLQLCLPMPFWPSCPIRHSSSKRREDERNGWAGHSDVPLHLSPVMQMFILSPVLVSSFTFFHYRANSKLMGDTAFAFRKISYLGQGDGSVGRVLA